MNKLLTKIVGVALGATMAVGVGVGVAVNNNRDVVDSEVRATTATIQFITTSSSNYVYDSSVATLDGTSSSKSGANFWGMYKTGGTPTLTTNSSFLIDTTKTTAVNLSARYYGGAAYGTLKFNILDASTNSVLATKSISPSTNKIAAYSETIAAFNQGTNKSVKFQLEGLSTNEDARFCGMTSASFTYNEGYSSSTAATINGDNSVNVGTQWSPTNITEDVGGATVSGGDLAYSFVASDGAVISAQNTSTGAFTASHAGTVTVSATKTGYTIASKVVTVNSIDPFITLTLNSGSTAYTGQTVDISATYGNGVAGLTWTVESGTISGEATASNSGYSATIGGNADSTLTIRAKDTGSALYEEVSVTVTKTTVSLNKNETSIAKGKSETLTASTNVGGVTWTSNNAKVSVAAGVVSVAADATVDSTATITATSDTDTSVSAQCVVTVIENVEASHTYASGDGMTVNIQNTSSVTVATATMAKKAGSSYSTPSFSGGQFKLYGSCTLTISPAMNYEILSFTTTFVNNKGGSKNDQLPDITYSVDGGSSSNLVSGTTYNVDSPSSILIETSASAGNRGFTKVTVTYKLSSSIVTLEEITYSGTLLKTTQYVGQDFDSVGLSFTAHYDNDTTAPILSSDIEWEELALGNSVTGTYQNVDVTVTGLEILNTSDADEIIFFNSLVSDGGAYSDLESYSKLGDFSVETTYVSNGANSSIRISSNDNGGSITLTNNVSGKYISKIIFIAKQYGTDTQALTVSGESTSQVFAPTSDWDAFELDVSDDEGQTATFSTPRQKRAYIHSITLVLESEDKTAVDFARKILNELTCTSSGTTAPSTSQWSALITYFNGSGNVSDDAKALLKTTEAPYNTWKDYVVDENSTESEIICAALVKYDFVVQKYLINQGLEAYEDFLGRFDEGGANANYGNINIKNAVTNNTPVVTTVIIISVIGLSTLCGYFLLRKRKEER